MFTAVQFMSFKEADKKSLLFQRTVYYGNSDLVLHPSGYVEFLDTHHLQLKSVPKRIIFVEYEKNSGLLRVEAKIYNTRRYGYFTSIYKSAFNIDFENYKEEEYPPFIVHQLKSREKFFENKEKGIKPKWVIKGFNLENINQKYSKWLRETDFKYAVDPFSRFRK